MSQTLPAVTVEEFQARLDAASTGPATSDDQSRMFDGRVLDSKEKVLAFLDELAALRSCGGDVEAS